MNQQQYEDDYDEEYSDDQNISKKEGSQNKFMRLRKQRNKLKNNQNLQNINILGKLLFLFTQRLRQITKIYKNFKKNGGNALKHVSSLALRYLLGYVYSDYLIPSDFIPSPKSEQSVYLEILREYEKEQGQQIDYRIQIKYKNKDEQKRQDNNKKNKQKEIIELNEDEEQQSEENENELDFGVFGEMMKVERREQEWKRDIKQWKKKQDKQRNRHRHDNEDNNNRKGTSHSLNNSTTSITLSLSQSQIHSHTNSLNIRSDSTSPSNSPKPQSSSHQHTHHQKQTSSKLKNKLGNDEQNTILEEPTLLSPSKYQDNVDNNVILTESQALNQSQIKKKEKEKQKEKDKERKQKGNETNRSKYNDAESVTDKQENESDPLIQCDICFANVPFNEYDSHTKKHKQKEKDKDKDISKDKRDQRSGSKASKDGEGGSIRDANYRQREKEREKDLIKEEERERRRNEKEQKKGRLIDNQSQSGDEDEQLSTLDRSKQQQQQQSQNSLDETPVECEFCKKQIPFYKYAKHVDAHQKKIKEEKKELRMYESQVKKEKEKEAKKEKDNIDNLDKEDNNPQITQQQIQEYLESKQMILMENEWINKKEKQQKKLNQKLKKKQNKARIKYLRRMEKILIGDSFPFIYECIKEIQLDEEDGETSVAAFHLFSQKVMKLMKEEKKQIQTEQDIDKRKQQQTDKSNPSTPSQSKISKKSSQPSLTPSSFTSSQPSSSLSIQTQQQSQLTKLIDTSKQIGVRGYLFYEQKAGRIGLRLKAGNWALNAGLQVATDQFLNNVSQVAQQFNSSSVDVQNQSLPQLWQYNIFQSQTPSSTSLPATAASFLVRDAKFAAQASLCLLPPETITSSLCPGQQCLSQWSGEEEILALVQLHALADGWKIIRLRTLAYQTIVGEASEPQRMQEIIERCELLNQEKLRSMFQNFKIVAAKHGILK